MEGTFIFSCLVNDGADQLVIVQKRVGPLQQDSFAFDIPASDATLIKVYPEILQDIAANFLISMNVAYTRDEQPIEIKTVPIQTRVTDSGIRVVISGKGTVLTEPLAYTVPARSDYRLQLPTLLSNPDPNKEYPLDIFTFNTTSMAGKSLIPKPTAFRWDLVTDVQFPQLRILRHYSCEDWKAQFNCNVHLETLPTATKQRGKRKYIAGDGSVFVDNTNLRVVSYQEFGLSTIPLICNCYLTKEGSTEPYHFGASIGGCTFDELPGKIRMTTQSGKVFAIDPTNRIEFDAREYLYFKEEIKI